MKNPKNNLPDQHLWRRVTRTVTPLRKGSAKSNAKKGPKENFADMMRVAEERPGAKIRPPHAAAQRQDKKVRRGQVSIDRRIDLHDMTQDQAFSALSRIIMRSYNQNLRCILVITGKGVRGQGVLRQNLPHWLEHPDIRPVVSEFAPAHIRHGGGGAWYVFLRGSPDRRLR